MSEGSHKGSGKLSFFIGLEIQSKCREAFCAEKFIAVYFQGILPKNDLGIHIPQSVISETRKTKKQASIYPAESEANSIDSRVDHMDYLFFD